MSLAPEGTVCVCGGVKLSLTGAVCACEGTVV